MKTVDAFFVTRVIVKLVLLLFILFWTLPLQIIALHEHTQHDRCKKHFYEYLDRNDFDKANAVIRCEDKIIEDSSMNPIDGIRHWNRDYAREEGVQ